MLRRKERENLKNRGCIEITIQIVVQYLDAFPHTEQRNSSNIERKKERKIEQQQHEAKRNNVEERNTQKEQQTQTRWMY